MAAYFYPSDEYEDDGLASPVKASPSTPQEVLSDQTMSIEAKRAILASWASDRRAVENWPALRRLDDGRELNIDDILDGLKALDTVDGKPHLATVLPFPRSRLAHSRQPDDDLDPPPAAIAMSVPKHRPYLDATASQALVDGRFPSVDLSMCEERR